MLMHEREYNHRSTSYVSTLSNHIGSFRRPRASDNYFSALVGDLSVLMLLIVATVGAIFAIQSPLGHGRYGFGLSSRTDAFTKSFSGALVRDGQWLDQQRAFYEEQHMGFSQLMNRWQPMIAEASRKFGVPASWIRAVMQMESGGRTMLTPQKPITSPVGAVGLMQLMPGTYKEMREEHKLGANPFNPHDNIMAGAAYLRWLHRKYGYPAMFVAYNDGPGNLESKLAGHRGLPAETQNYVAKITALLGGTARQSGLRAAVKLTRPNGTPVWIDPRTVASVRAALPGEYPRGVQAIVTVGRSKQGVRESVAAAKAAIRAHVQYA